MTSPEDPLLPHGPPHGPAKLGRLWVVAAGSALLMALGEAALIAPAVLGSEGFAALATLMALLFGNWLPYAFAGAVWLVGCDTAARWLERRDRSLIWLGLLGAASFAPYTAWLSHFTMSGPNVGSHPLRWLWIVLLTAALTSGLGALAAFVGLRVRWRRWALALGIGWWVLACGALLLSQLYLPNEYEPLHAALGYLAVLSAVLGASELARALPRPRSRPALILTGSALAASALASSLVLANSNRLAWWVWGETPGSRYVTARLDWHDESFDAAVAGSPQSTVARTSSDPQRARRAARPAPHVFVFSIDNLQPDHVGAYGYRRRPSTPNIDRVAQRGTLFLRAYSYQPQTRVFMTSMLLGRRIPDFGAHRFPPAMQETSLPRALKARDYFTLVKGVFELTKYREFDPTDYLIDSNIERETPEIIRRAKSMPHVPYAERFRIVDEHLQKASGRPVFVWLHLLGPHWFGGSFDPSGEFPFGKDLEARYDSAIAGTDVWLAHLQRVARERLQDDRDVYWIVMSDHGAGLAPGGTKREKGKSVLERHVHVPLIIAGPGIQHGTVDVPVDSALDVAATILDLAGIDPPASYDGHSLVPLLQERELSKDLTERVIPLRNAAWSGAVSGKWKYVSYRKVDQLFDLSQDPHETRNLADDHPALVRRLRKVSRKQLKAATRAFQEAAAERAQEAESGSVGDATER